MALRLRLSMRACSVQARPTMPAHVLVAVAPWSCDNNVCPTCWLSVLAFMSRGWADAGPMCIGCTRLPEDRSVRVCVGSEGERPRVEQLR